jgi:hypothetical protein
MTDPILNQGEAVIKKTDAKEYLSFGRNSAWLTLTNQRLIIRDCWAPIRLIPFRM